MGRAASPGVAFEHAHHRRVTTRPDRRPSASSPARTRPRHRPLTLTRWRNLWAPFGAALHVGLALWVDLGIFSYAMLALYPLVVPDLTVRALDRPGAAVDRARSR